MIENRFAEFRTRLDDGAIGIFSKTTDSAMVEAAGLSGLDFLIVDLEHGGCSWEGVQNHIRAANLTGMAPIVRVPGCVPHVIGQVLDSGATGVQVPNVSTESEARRAVESARFYPEGGRGVCRFVRAAGYGSMPTPEYFSISNEAVVILQVEGKEGIENIDAILAVPGIDVLFIGPYDLSQSAGRPGEVDAPEVVEMISAIVEKATAVGARLGTFVDTIAKGNQMRKQGIHYVATSVDVGLFYHACREVKKGVS